MPSFEFRRLSCFDNTELFSSENENAYFPFHFHDVFCVSLITKGTELLRNTEQEFIAPSGSISITQANEVHRNYSLIENGYSYTTIYVNPAVLQFHNAGKKVFSLERVIYDEALFRSFSSLVDGQHKDILLWERSFRKLASYSTDPDAKNGLLHSFSLIDELIEDYPNKPVDTDWLAKKFCMSKYHFIRQFKKAKGVTPQTYIMLYRLGKAKKMILQNTALQDISYATGFCDPSHFTNSFKKYFGVAPANFLRPVAYNTVAD